MSEADVRVAVTGAAGQIGYSLLFRIASGEMLGSRPARRAAPARDTRAVKAAEGVAMELDDCAFPLLARIEVTDDPKLAFDGVNIALLVGAKPRVQGMERRD